MAKLTFKGQAINTVGELPKIGETVNFSNLVKNDLTQVNLESYTSKTKILSFFPSIDTGVCQASVRTFNKEAAQLKNTVVLNISADLPFANGRFCGAEGITNCESLSTFRSNLGQTWGLNLADSPLAGLLARAVVVLSATNKVLYSELVSEITHEPNYKAALQAASLN